jgi:hypothetical protein
MQQIFISYSRKDIAFVRRLAGDLEKAGYDVWWDLTDLRGGDDWPRVIPAAIESSAFFLVVLSPNSAVSDWVEKEYTLALDLRKKIIPIMYKRSSIPFSLNTINYVNFASGEYADNFKNLLNALGYTGEPPVIKSPALGRYTVPIIIGSVLLLTLLLIPLLFTQHTPLETSTPTPVSPTVTATASATDTEIPTASPTVTLIPAATNTITPHPTLTPSMSPTIPPFNRLTFCVNSLYANTINVRSGPGTIYPPLGEPLLVGTCLAFSARNEEGTWLQVAPNQTDPTLLQYEGGWIFRELLGLGSSGPIDLPAVTLTPTPIPSDTPTLTLTFTRTPAPTITDSITPTPTFTSTDTPALTETDTPLPIETPTP